MKTKNDFEIDERENRDGTYKIILWEKLKQI
jgi:hypothetical protein